MSLKDKFEYFEKLYGETTPIRDAIIEIKDKSIQDKLMILWRNGQISKTSKNPKCILLVNLLYKYYESSGKV